MVERIAISRLSGRGDGVADTPAGRVYVPYTLPGETVLAEPIAGQPDRLADRFAVTGIDTASAERVAPLCKYFGQCGGCALQHWELAKQQDWKRQLVTEALRHEDIAQSVNATLDAHGEGRRRAVFHARWSGPDTLDVGFAAPRAHRIVAIDRCPILAPGLDGALAAARAIAEALKPARKPLDIHVTAADNGLDVDVRGSGPLDKSAVATLGPLAKTHRIVRLTRHGELVTQQAQPVLKIGVATVPLPPASFLQATALGEETLARLVVDAIGKAKRVADLFCGIGPFALRLAQFAQVVAADSDAPAIAALTSAATATRGLKPIKATARDLFRRPFVAQELAGVDAVVFDPPRQGAEAQARELARGKIPVVVAVSCDRTTFARDARILIEGGYRVTAITPVDQFRYSPHVEIVARFMR